MADGDLAHAGHHAQKVGEVVAVEVVPGVHAQPAIERGLGGGAKALQLRGLRRGAPGGGVGLGVQLHAVGAHGFGGGHLAGLGVHEQADAHAQGFGLGHQRGQALGVLRKLPAVVAGELAFAVGHKGHLLGAHAAHKTHEVVEGVALDVVLAPGPGFEQLGQLGHVGGADVAFIGPGVHGDAVGTGLQTLGGGARQAGNAEVPGVAQRGHFVDVDRQGAAGVESGGGCGGGHG